jgi:radical SAM superfamily enzyme YgiQ (UPF0313 family)
VKLRVALVGTYDLGRQPFGLASPAAWLRRAGATVTLHDHSVEPLDDAALGRADLVAFHVPMHTATRLAARHIAVLAAAGPRPHLAAYGLYAPMNATYLRGLGVDSILGGEFEASLVRLAEALAAGTAPAARDAPDVSLERLAFIAPDRRGLPPLGRYARLVDGPGEPRITGATEASRGCKHRCRHCPIVPVYGGRFRVVPREVVLEDVRRQVEAGAAHITFGDPDFFNGPGHALPLVRALHAEHPGLTYDVTIKVEHLLRHADAFPVLRETGCRFVTSAVEAVDDRILEILDKGHTRADVVRVLDTTRAAGLYLNPTFVAFTPWIDRAGYVDLLDFIEAHGLVDAVAPVQLSIRLLLPPGSLLLGRAETAPHLGDYDEAALAWRWRHPDPEMDALQRNVADLVVRGAAAGLGRRQVFERVRAAAAAAFPRARWRSHLAAAPPRAPVPFLTEPWYC